MCDLANVGTLSNDYASAIDMNSEPERDCKFKSVERAIRNRFDGSPTALLSRCSSTGPTAVRARVRDTAYLHWPYASVP